ncbi:hypothetical protein MTO96_048054 [Rhipicephalus appendiculatus]
MVSSLAPALFLLAAYSGTQAAWSGQSEANYFLDDMLAYPEDNYTLPDFGLDVDVMVDDFLDYVQFEFSNGTASRFQRRVQRQGDCHNPYGQRVACNLNLAGLYVRYGVVRVLRSSGDKFTSAELFVNKGSAVIEMSFPRGGNMVGSTVSALFLLVVYSGTQAAWNGHSQADYFLDDQLLSFPEDTITLPDFGLDVDFLDEDGFLDYARYEFSNGTASRFQRRVQRQGGCRNPFGRLVVCDVNLTGLYVRYGIVRLVKPSSDKVITAELFVNNGSAVVKMSFPQGEKSKLLSFLIDDLKMTMRRLPEVLVSAEVDKIFAEKTTSKCERMLRRILEGDYASLLGAVIGNETSINI